MKIRKIVIGILMFLIIMFLFTGNKIEAVEVPEEVPEEISSQLQNMTNEDILEIYDKITEEYTNDEIANIIGGTILVLLGSWILISHYLGL